MYHEHHQQDELEVYVRPLRTAVTRERDRGMDISLTTRQVLPACRSLTLQSYPHSCCPVSRLALCQPGFVHSSAFPSRIFVKHSIHGECPAQSVQLRQCRCFPLPTTTPGIFTCTAGHPLFKKAVPFAFQRKSPSSIILRPFPQQQPSILCTRIQI